MRERIFKTGLALAVSLACAGVAPICSAAGPPVSSAKPVTSQAGTKSQIKNQASTRGNLPARTSTTAAPQPVKKVLKAGVKKEQIKAADREQQALEAEAREALKHPHRSMLHSIHEYEKPLPAKELD